MIKMRTIKNSYLTLKENYTHKITEKEAFNHYMLQLIEEVESIPKEERVYYTAKEFWKMVEEKEIERYGHKI